jgi:hypothetical protein
VVREQPGDLVLSTGVGLLEPGGRFAVQPDTFLGHQGAICGLLDERVLEAELRLGPAAGLPHQVQTLKIGERASDVDALARDRLEQRQAELPPEDRGRHQRRARPGPEPVDARHDHLLDGRRDLDGDLVIEPPPLVRAHERARVGERAHELLEEERVALGRLEDPPFHLGGHRAFTDERVQKLTSGVAG